MPLSSEERGLICCGFSVEKSAKGLASSGHFSDHLPVGCGISGSGIFEAI